MANPAIAVEQDSTVSLDASSNNVTEEEKAAEDIHMPLLDKNCFENINQRTESTSNLTTNSVSVLTQEKTLDYDSEKTDDEEDDIVSTNKYPDIDQVEGMITIFEFMGDDLVQKGCLELHHDLTSKHPDELSSSENDDDFQCRVCKKTYTTWAGYREHLKSHNKRENTICQVCSKPFRNKTHMLRHIRSCHDKERPFICRYCGKGFSTEWYCQKHESHHENGTGPRIAARGRVYKCQYCTKVFSKPRLKQMHESCHTGKKSFMCIHCKKMFCYSSSLVKHLKSIHAENPESVCPYCDQIFSSPESLFKHSQFHIGVNQYRCKDCDVVFGQPIALKRHRRLNHYDTVKRPYKCDQCNKCFTHSSMLSVHQRTHTGVKPFSCSQCQKSFTQKSHLKTHLRSHSGERPFNCQFCCKGFRDQGSLSKHERAHTGEKPFQCPYCNKTFTVKHVLNRHVKTHEVNKYPTVINVDLNFGSETSIDDASHLIAAALQNISQGIFDMPQQGQENVVATSSDVIETQEEVPAGYQQEGQPVMSIQMAPNPQGSQSESIPSQGVSEHEEISIHPVANGDQNAEEPQEILAANLIEEQMTFQLTDTPAAPSLQNPSDNLDTEKSIQEASQAVIDNIQQVVNDLSIKQGMEVSSLDVADVSVEQDVETTANASGRVASPDSVTIGTENSPMDSVLQEASINLNEYDVSIPVELISPSIMNNPYMEKVRHKSRTQPVKIFPKEISSMSESIAVTASVNSETGTQQGKDGDIIDKYSAVFKNNSQRPEEDSESTDDEVAPEPKEKVFESINIFELSGSNLVCKGKIDMFEPKFHQKCRICNKNFFSQSGLDQHLKRHETGPNLPFICSYCGRGFTAKASLRAHEAIHTGESLYKCKECPREFRNYSSFRIHMAVHTGEKPFTCEFCGQSFAQVAHVQRHERSHTGARPYGCSYCGKAFAEWGTWQRHVRIHTGEKPYVCQICKKGFSVKFALKRHLSTHKGEGEGSISITPKDPRRPKGGRLGNHPAPSSESVGTVVPLPLGLQVHVISEEQASMALATLDVT